VVPGGEKRATLRYSWVVSPPTSTGRKGKKEQAEEDSIRGGGGCGGNQAYSRCSSVQGGVKFYAVLEREVNSLFTVRSGESHLLFVQG